MVPMTPTRDRRWLLVRIGFVALLAPLTSCSRNRLPSRVRRIGFINGSEAEMNEAFFDELERLGYVHKRDLIVETRLLTGAPGELQKFIGELAAMDIEFVVAGALPMAAAMRQANPEMPMVIATCPGMITNGFAQTLEQPGGIVTGMDELPPGVTAKRLQLLKLAAPDVARIALLSTTPGNGGHETQLTEAEQTAASLGVGVQPYRAGTPADLDAALQAIAADGNDALLNFQGGLSLFKRKQILEFAAAHRLPAIYQATLFAQDGGLMSWAPDINQQFRTAARYADQILQGAEPGELPIQHPNRYFLTVNSRAAERIGLTLPAALLASADAIL
jgi:putative ABC transport system substrate-binding protein